jgi:putative CocE/NonD family hydrolase
MAEDTEVTGPINATIFASTSAPDTDFIVRLLDVEPDGTAYNLTEGIIRTRFRKSIYDPPELLDPGEIFPYEIELLPTSNVFLAGHRIAVHITSSSFPMYDRNPNTGHTQGMDTELRVAHQTIFHDAARSSHVKLPIIQE